jgi:hypothetical protein
MSEAKVNHNKWKPFDELALAATGTGDDATSEWWDCSGWTDKRVSWESDGANPDFDIDMHISALGAYELNNITATTEHYEVINIVTAHGANIVASKDAEDIDELQRPFASVRFFANNDSATAIDPLNAWFEGWS